MNYLQLEKPKAPRIKLISTGTTSFNVEINSPEDDDEDLKHMLFYTTTKIDSENKPFSKSSSQLIVNDLLCGHPYSMYAVSNKG